MLELVVVIALISVLVAFAIDRLLVMKVRAERTAMEQVLGSLRSGMTIRLSEMMIRGQLAQAGRLAGTNPMQVLLERPQNYLGEFFGPDPASLEPGNWYFDTREGVLCYLVDSAEYFESRLNNPARACFKIRPVFEDVNGNGRYDPGIDLLRGLQLAPTEHYGWHLRLIWPGHSRNGPKRIEAHRYHDESGVII